MAYNVFRSDDTGAPSLTGQVSSLINLLDACLVSGFNTKTITITRSGTTATATCSAHGFRNYQNLTISGANESDYNGTFVISNVTTNTFDYTVANSPTSPATGTISAKVTPLGWTKPYTGTNLAAFRMGAVSGSGPQGYLRVDDTGAQDSRVYGHVTMSDVNTGTDRFPTNTQQSGGLYLRKSVSADSQVRGWILWGNEKLFHLLTYGAAAAGATLIPNSTNYDPNTSHCSLTFGAFESYTPSDAWNLFIIAPSVGNGSMQLGYTGSAAATPTNWPSFYIARDYQAIASKTGTIMWGLNHGSARATNATGYPSFPSGISGKLHYNSDLWIIEAETTSAKYGIRGKIPGIGSPHCDLISSTRRYWDTLQDGTKYFLVAPCHSGSASYGCVLVRLDAADTSWSTL